MNVIKCNIVEFVQYLNFDFNLREQGSIKLSSE